MNSKKLLPFIFFFTCTNLFSAPLSSDIEVPRSVYKDRYKYYIEERAHQGMLHFVTLKRISADSMLFVKTEIDCTSRIIREMGHSVSSTKKINTSPPPQWYKPKIISIEADLINYVCH